METVNDYEEIRQVFFDIANLRDKLKAKSDKKHFIRDMNDVDLNNAMVELSKALNRLLIFEK